ncbi:hypothetical protein CGLO_05684 [Colletotrichum gloeosporioides Cg-14]|uniref:Uncharacterized protein n=1 Tax=Colletotrichum gloeosporioides (strain Cg-14) TaxID=1237896 RepID=T0M147_COLGC|nr:hypothetical protein CGLO_05684 [Colletotrichum gloeosporioides Cg-14]
MASKPVPLTPSTVATPSGSEADRLYGSYRDGGIRSPHTTRRLNKYAAKYPSPQQGLPANRYQSQPPPGPPPQQYGYQYQPSQGAPASQYQYPYQQQLQGPPPPQQYWSQHQQQSPQYPYGHQAPPPAHYNQPQQHQPQHQPPQLPQHQPQPQQQQQPRGGAPPQTPTVVAVPRPTTAQMDLLLDQYGDEIQQFASPTPSRQPAPGQVHDETALDTPKARMEFLLQQFKEGMEAAMHADFEMRKIVYKEEFQ